MLKYIPNRVLLDVMCGAGGTSKGYKEAGFFVIGVDKDPQPNYAGDIFIQADAFEVLDALLNEEAQFFGEVFKPVAVHASPPCQGYSDLQKQNKRAYPLLIAPIRERLEKLGLPYVIENVEGAPLHEPIVLCGTMFPGLRVIRHRQFESNIELAAPAGHPEHPLVFTHDKRKAHYGKLDQDTSFVQVTGGGNATIANKRAAMGIDWQVTNLEVNEAIPPAYTKWIGDQLMAYIEAA